MADPTPTAQWCDVCVISRLQAQRGHCGVPIPVPQPPDCLMVALERSAVHRLPGDGYQPLTDDPDDGRDAPLATGETDDE